MSVLYVPIYKTEEGLHQNPAVYTAISTSCDGGVSGEIKKKFIEVIIHWDGAAWVEDSNYIPGSSIVVLKIINVCDDSFSYIDYGFNDFRLKQICCVNETPEPNDEFSDEHDSEFN